MTLSNTVTETADFALRLADAARDAIAAAPPLRAEVKADRSFVTDLDRSIERRLRALIATRFPDHGVIARRTGPTAPTRPASG